MRKKTLIILLVIPFIIAILSFVSVAILDNTVLTDISDILWNYEEYEGFQISTTERYELQATPVAGANVKLANGNELTWRVDKINDSDPEFAQIEEEEGKFYLKALEEGECKVVCSNVRGTKSKYFFAEIYEDGAIIINTTPASSSESVTGNRCFGEYDLKYSGAAYGAETLKERAKFTINVKVLGSENGEYYISGKSDNISVSNNKDVTINASNDESFITVRTLDDSHLSKTYKFSVIENGVNVYSYNDLLMCTNYSKQGEIICMQTNLKSYEETFNDNGEYKSNNTKLFGNRDGKGKYYFVEELYTTETTYSHKFIDQYNKEMGTNYTTKILVGIRAQKNIYGNGFTINAHNLCAPKTLATIGKPKLDPSDLYRGPLAYVTIGNVSTDPLVKAFGQDNVGLYLDADGIVVDDLKFSNISNQSNVSNFFYSGSVVDVNAKNVTIKNSVLSNGRTVVRAFSSDGLTIDNCNLMNAGEFILKIGSNKFVEPDVNKTINIDGESSLSGRFSEVFGKTERKDSDTVPADDYFNEVLMGGNMTQSEASKAETVLNKLQDALDNKTYNDGEFDSSVVVNDTNFSNSGLFSVAFDSMYNGPYLYSGMPSQIGDVLAILKGFTVPRGIGGTSLPVRLTIGGNSKFYDWKKAANIDTSALVETNFDILASAIPQLDGLTVDDFFPIKKIVIEQARNEKRLYKDENGNEWLNTEFAWYGGGLNNSVLINNAAGANNSFSERKPVDILKTNLLGEYLTSNMNSILAKCVTFAIGFHPFNFITNGGLSSGEKPDVEQRPQINDLTNNFRNRG